MGGCSDIGVSCGRSGTGGARAVSVARMGIRDDERAGATGIEYFHI
jgi:hypothetical protein